MMHPRQWPPAELMPKAKKIQIHPGLCGWCCQVCEHDRLEDKDWTSFEWTFPAFPRHKDSFGRHALITRVGRWFPPALLSQKAHQLIPDDLTNKYVSLEVWWVWFFCCIPAVPICCCSVLIWVQNQCIPSSLMTGWTGVGLYNRYNQESDCNH